MEPESFFFFWLLLLGFIGAASAGIILLAFGFYKKSKVAKVIGLCSVLVSILPGLFVGSWIYHWFTAT